MKKTFLCILFATSIFAHCIGQAQFAWPNTTSAVVFQDFLKAYNTGEPDEVRSFAKKHYANPSEDKVDEVTEYWMDYFYRLGPAEAHSISINKPYDLEVWLQGTISKVWFAPEFILNEKSGKVKAVGLLLGEQPKHSSSPSTSIEEFYKRLSEYLFENEKKDLFQGNVKILHGDKTTFNKSYGFKNIEKGVYIDKDTRFDIASVSKPITAIAVLQLAQKGLIDLYVPIEKYLPDLPKNLSSEITIFQLLTHTSNYKLKAIKGFREEVAKTTSLKEVYQVHLKYLPMWDKFKDFESIERWNYSNQGYDLLGIIVEVISKLSFEDYLEKNIFNKAGMVNTSFSSDDVATPYRYDLTHNVLKDFSDYPAFFGKISGAAQLKSTTSDLARLFQLVKNTDSILDEEYKSLFYAPLVKRYRSNYQSLGLKLNFETPQHIGHGGVAVGNTSELYYFPKLDLLVVILCNNRSGAPNLLRFIKNNLPKSK